MAFKRSSVRFRLAPPVFSLGNQSDFGLPITGRPDNSRGSLKNSPYSASLRLKTPATTGVFSTLTANNTSPRPKHACENTVCADGHIARHDDRPFSKPAAGAAACGASSDVGPAPPEYPHLRTALSPARRVHRGCHFWRSVRGHALIGRTALAMAAAPATPNTPVKNTRRSMEPPISKPARQARNWETARWIQKQSQMRLERLNGRFREHVTVPEAMTSSILAMPHCTITLRAQNAA